MGQLTNQYVSQSYQGLLNLENPFTGVTNTLQYVTDGIGNKIPMQVSTSSVVISGSFYGDGSNLTGVTYTTPAGTVSGSQQIVDLGFATTSSLTSLSQSIASTDLGQDNRLTSLEQFTGSIDTGYVSESEFGNYTSSMNNFTSSIDGRVDALEIETGSLQNQINQKLDTGSFNTYSGNTLNLINSKLDSGSFNSYTSSNDLKVNDLISKTGSYATTGSNNFVGQQNINGSVNVTGSLNVTGTVTATSASFQYVNTVYETASVIYSSGSNQFGDASNDTQTLYGTVKLPNGPLDITGSLKVSGPTNLNNSLYVTGQTEFSSSIYPVSILGNQTVSGYVSASSFTGSLQGTASYATQALSASYAPDTTNTGSLVADVALGLGNNIINVTKGDGSTTSLTIDDVTNASFAQNAVSSSHSVNSNTSISSSYSDFAVSSSQSQNSVSSSHSEYSKNSELLNNTGSGVFATTGSNIFTGQQTILNDLTINSSNPFGTFVNMISTGTTSFNMDSPITQFQSNGQMVFTNTLSSTGSSDISFLTQNGGDIILNTSNSGSIAVSGSLNITGSASVNGSTLRVLSRNTTIPIDSYLTSSLSGQSNIILGWTENPAAGGAAANQANYTGSLRITGSNNIVNLPVLRPTALGQGADQTYYISGSNNFINTNQGGIMMNTGSLLFPKTAGNIIGVNSAIAMTFTTSSLAGGHPTINNNLILGGAVIINHPSGSVAATNNTIIGGQIASSQNFVTNTRPSFAANNIIGTITLNHISSSINYNTNYNNSPVTINNHVSSSAIANNSLTVNSNTFLGGSSNNGHSIYTSGSQSTNVTRNITDNLIGGRNNIVSSSFVSSSNSNLVSTIVYGNGLAVSGSHTVNTNGGSAFFGRFNATGSNQEDAQSTVFAVGTGTAVGARKTGFRIDNNSNTTISGSLTSIGNATITGSLNVTGSVTIADAGDLNMYGHKMFNIGGFQNNSTISGSANVSQSVSYDVTDVSYGVTLVSGSQITFANAGVYLTSFSAQLLADSGADTVYMWLKKNGTNVPESATKLVLDNNKEAVMTVNFLNEVNANDYIEVAWQSTNGDAVIFSEAASGNIPTIPSIIVTTTQVR